MATTTYTARAVDAKRPSSSRQKRDQHHRTDIWSNLLRQTREAQARNRTQAIQTRDLIVCGGQPEDQRAFLDRYLARPPPQPATRNPRDQRPQREKGEVRLSNRFGYGYGHVTLYSPPQPSSGALGLFSGEAEEVARINVHTLCSAAPDYSETLRRLLRPTKAEDTIEDMDSTEEDAPEAKGRRAAICILMSWTYPWCFLEQMHRWYELIAAALRPTDAPRDEPALGILQEHQVRLSVVLQHTERQEDLLREMYTEEMFDYISQCLRTCLLPISAALLYVPTNLPPQQPGAPLSEVQKVLYTSLDLDTSALQAKVGKPELTAKHNVVDRMAIVVPSGWDSLGKIRLLSETFSPEAVLEGWKNDLATPILFTDSDPEPSTEGAANDTHTGVVNGSQSEGGAEVFETTHQPSPLVVSPQPSPPMSPSKMPKSARKDYEDKIIDPDAHKRPYEPEVEVTTQPEQEFLAEMRAQLQQYEAQDAAAKTNNLSYASGGTMHTGRFNIHAGGVMATGEALSELGDVSFNVGGVSYNTQSAEQAIERLKRPQGGNMSDSRSGTPRPARRDQKTGSDGTPGSKGGEIPTEKLEEYFASLMKRGGGGSQSGTPSKQ